MKKLAILAVATVMSVQSFALKIGTVNTQELFFGYSKTKTMDANLKKQAASLENSLKQKQIELQKLKLELDGKGAKITDKEKTDFETKVKALEKFVKDSEIKLSKERETRIKEIEKTITDSIQKVAAKEKADYILEAGAVKFGGTDYTKKVLAEMEKAK